MLHYKTFFFFRLRSETDRSFLFTLNYRRGRVFTPEGRPLSSHNWARREGSRFYLPRIDFQVSYRIQHVYLLWQSHTFNEIRLQSVMNMASKPCSYYPFGYFFLPLRTTLVKTTEVFSLNIVDVFKKNPWKAGTVPRCTGIFKHTKNPWTTERSSEQTVIPPKNAVELDWPKSYGVKNNDAYWPDICQATRNTIRPCK